MKPIIKLSDEYGEAKLSFPLSATQFSTIEEFLNPIR